MSEIEQLKQIIQDLTKTVMQINSNLENLEKQVKLQKTQIAGIRDFLQI